MAVSYFPDLVFSKLEIQRISVIRYPRICCFQVSFGWHTSGHTSGRAYGTLFTPHGLLSINVKVLVSFTGKNIFFAVCHASLNGFIKGSDRIDPIKLY